MCIKTPTLKRYRAEDREFVNFAFVIVQVDGKSLGIDLSLGTQCIELYAGHARRTFSCVYTFDLQLRLSVKCTAVLLQVSSTVSLTDMKMSCAIECTYKVGE